MLSAKFVILALFLVCLLIGYPLLKRYYLWLTNTQEDYEAKTAKISKMRKAARKKIK